MCVCVYAHMCAHTQMLACFLHSSPFIDLRIFLKYITQII